MAKTIKVETIVDMVNIRNATSTCSKQERQGWNILLESILHDTGNYEGFRYLDKSEVPEKQLPGIVYIKSEDGKSQIAEFPDDTRRFYH